MKTVLQALVLAERVYTDTSGKKIIAGTFNVIRFKKGVPLVHKEEGKDGEVERVVLGGMEAGSPAVYISLTDVVDGTTITLRFINISKNVTIFGADFNLTCNDRLKTIEIVAPLPQLAPFLDGPGTYAIEILCEGDILGSHRLLAKEIE